MHFGWLFTCLHWPFCPGVFIAILAVVAVVVTFRLTPDTTRREKAFWIIVCFVLMLGEIWMMSRDRDTHDKTEKDARDTEQQQSANISYLMLQSSTANANLADINRKVDNAKGDHQLIAKLQPKIAAAQTQAASATRALLLSLAPGIVDEMRYLADQWDVEDRRAEIGPMRDQFKKAHPEIKDPDIDEALFNFRAKQKADLTASYVKKILPVMTSANSLREELLRGSQLTDEDNKNALIFAKALGGESIYWSQMGQVAGYMAKLVRSSLTPSPITNLKGTAQ
jgi:hypothetical protein